MARIPTWGREAARYPVRRGGLFFAAAPPGSAGGPRCPGSVRGRVSRSTGVRFGGHASPGDRSHRPALRLHPPGIPHEQACPGHHLGPGYRWFRRFCASRHLRRHRQGNSFDSKLARKIEAAGGTITARLPQIGVAIVESKMRLRHRAGRVPGVRSAVSDLDCSSTCRRAESIDENFSNPPESGDNDTRFDLQWGHAAIDVAGAWNQGYRGAGAKVAVLDSGIACAPRHRRQPARRRFHLVRGRRGLLPRNDQRASITAPT